MFATNLDGVFRLPGRRAPHDRARRGRRQVRPAGRDLEHSPRCSAPRNEHYAKHQKPPQLNALCRALFVELARYGIAAF